ncbi:TIGR00288 family protein [Raineyella antarctica]|uniref:TIGR00288 family protein n=1 Tax=Raineyella antarctica TaxID=1577474 RepID=A0A1G6GQG9_9ACTN|nr:NYN domain-containing protein [Raineyella antarctica]SDB83446.1 TIGR00288 family protein [Raineyella antarctica]
MDTNTSASTRIAVLIDCDNVSASHAEAVLEELATYGTPTIKRAYGDWTTGRLAGWKRELNRLAITPVQQFAYTVGKNSTDSALIIDAMDLLWMGNVEAFALVSSDSDFTRLATRLRESGKKVFGLGRRHTPESLRKAVDQFIYLELLDKDLDSEAVPEPTAAVPASATTPSDAGAMTPGRATIPGAAAAPEDTAEPVAEADAGPQSSGINLQSALVRAVNATSGDDGWVGLSLLGQHLNRAHTDFDPRDFGHRKLSTLVAAQPYLETRTSNGTMQVHLKGSGTVRGERRR